MRVLILSGLLALTALAGCASDDGTRPVGSDGPRPITPASVASYLHNLSAPVEGLSVLSGIVEQYRIVTAGEIELDTWIVRPDVDGPVPLVLTVTPYYGGGSPLTATGHALGRLGDELVSRGYAVGISSVRGTGNSGGCFTIGSPQEALDTANVIETLAKEPWSNGNVGLIGVSYDGTTPQDVWVEAPPSLKAVVPIAGISDLYKYNFANGVPINVQGFGFNTYYWVLVGAVPFPLGATGNPDPVAVPGAVAGEACTDQAEVQEGGVSSTVDGNKDAYWQERDFLAELNATPEKQRAAVFYVHGLQDWNVKPHNMEDWLPAVQAAGVPFKAWLGQWDHNWPESTDPAAKCTPAGEGDVAACRTDWWSESMVAWFDEFLVGRDTGILDAPAVQVQDDDGTWRHETEWPPTDVAWRELHLGDGALQDAPGSGETSYFDYWGEPVGANAGAVSLAQTGAQGPASAVFLSEPFEADTHLSGLPRFEGNATASGNRASLMLSLVEVFPDGRERPFNFAAQSLNHVADLAAGMESVAGLTQRVAVDFFPQDDIVHKGSRLAFVASGNLILGDQPGPAFQPVSDGSTITLSFDGARLLLPVDGSIVVEEPQPYDV